MGRFLNNETVKTTKNLGITRFQDLPNTISMCNSSHQRMDNQLATYELRKICSLAGQTKFSSCAMAETAGTCYMRCGY